MVVSTAENQFCLILLNDDNNIGTHISVLLDCVTWLNRRDAQERLLHVEVWVAGQTQELRIPLPCPRKLCGIVQCPLLRILPLSIFGEAKERPQDHVWCSCLDI